MELSNNEMPSFQPETETLSEQRVALAEQIAIANSQGLSDLAEKLQERLDKLGEAE
jgi:hypothetical protein